MKLLKLLATGVVALSISTSSMAQTSYYQPVPIGRVIATGIIMVAGAIAMKLNYSSTLKSPSVTDVTLPQGRLSNVLTDAGPVVEQSGDGELNGQVLMSQTGFDLTDTNNAISSCAQQSTSSVRYHLPSKEDLVALVNALPNLKRNFELASKNPFNSGYIPTADEIKSIRTDLDALKERVDGGGALLTSNQAGPGTAVTVDANGTLGTVAKDALTPYVCVSYYTSRMLGNQGLLNK